MSQYPKNERTSKRVATIAGQILRIRERRLIPDVMIWGFCDGKKTLSYHHFDWKDIRALAASALTQVQDRKATRAAVRKRARTKAGKAARGQKRVRTIRATTKTKSPRAGSVGAVRGRGGVQLKLSAKQSAAFDRALRSSVKIVHKAKKRKART